MFDRLSLIPSLTTGMLLLAVLPALAESVDTAWVRRYNGAADSTDEACAIAVDCFGNVYVTGQSYGGSAIDKDYVTIKYYSNGDTAWVRRYNGPGSNEDVACAIAVDASGSVYVTGRSAQASSAPYNFDYATIKYYPNGDTAWVRRYNGPATGDDFANALTIDDSNNVYVTGFCDGVYTVPGDYATIKYYPNGETAWVRKYQGPGNHQDVATAIAVDDSHNVYVAGYSYGIETGADYACIKYHPNGDTAWVRRYDGSGSSDYAEAIAVDGSGNVYVTGWAYGLWPSADYITEKYGPNGDQLWRRNYNGPGNDYDRVYAMSVDDSGNVYVTGMSYGGMATEYDYATIKYVQTGTDVQDETGTKEKPADFALSQNYPNPFNQTTKMEFTLARSGFVCLAIYDILGRKVKTLVSEHLSSGYKSVLWEGKNDSGEDVASGIYFCQLKVEDPASGGIGDFTETKKLVLLK